MFARLKKDFNYPGQPICTALSVGRGAEIGESQNRFFGFISENGHGRITIKIV
jgi:hypothetical protein